MFASPLAALAGAAAGTFASNLLGQAGDALSFLNVLGSAQNAGPDAASPGKDGAVRAEDLERQARELLDRFHQKFSQRLAEAGIPSGLTIHLADDGQGNVVLAEDHPDRQQIEALLAEDWELCDQFHQLSALYGLVQAAGRYQQATAEHEFDPLAVQGRFGDNGSAPPGVFRVVIRSDAAEVEFE